MSNYFNCYRVLTQELVEKVGILIEPTRYYYNYNNNECALQKFRRDDNTTNSFYLQDMENTAWDRDKDCLIIKQKYIFDHPNLLFGPNGIAPMSSSIGVALVWTSSGSSQRGVVKIAKINFQQDEQKIEFELNHSFKDVLFYDSVSFHTILYIESCGQVNNAEDGLANIPGSQLGDLNEIETICLDGQASEFNIFIEPQLTSNDPLWKTDVHIVDPREDKMSSTVSIILNPHHPDYSKFNENREFKIEVLRAALVCIIGDIKYSNKFDVDFLNNDDDCREESVAEALLYFKNDLHWKLGEDDTLSELSQSIYINTLYPRFRGI